MKKRVTAYVGGWLVASTIAKLLKEAGIDVKLVTKHAVQVHPDHAVQAASIMREYQHDNED